MAIPDKIKVSYLADYHTENVGRHGDDDGQFMAFVVATLPEIFASDWQKHKRWYAVLHTFDTDGHHVNTDARFAGVTADGEDQVAERAWGWIEEMLAALGPITREDIEVRLFSVQVDGRAFGLLDTSHISEDDGTIYETVTLLPNDFVFTDPWDGDYDT
ncbi:MAG: hypothetical protein ABIY70_00085 [Capsulimonas sp.]|uniref:hypothetical protein n=1 Tax=Capsulimonas sp. TaxID=2494211 RepID=UPI003264B9E2